MRLADDASFVLWVCNEEYWLDYVLRPLVQTNIPIWIANSGSTDNTLKIIKSYGRRVGVLNVPEIEKWEKGLLRTHLAIRTDTHWVIQVNGDEIWTPEGIDAVLNLDVDKRDRDGVYVELQNIVWRPDGFHLANVITRCRVHWRMTIWDEEYPWRPIKPPKHPIYLKSNKPVAYHLHYLKRSSHDTSTEMRIEALAEHGEPEAGEPIDLFSMWGAPRFLNPYWEELQVKNGKMGIWENISVDNCILENTPWIT